MRVSELAKDLGVSSDVLIQLLRSMRISASGAASSMTEADVSVVLARVERERRAGHESATAAIEAAIEDSQAASGRSRRRRRRAPEPDAVEAEEASDAGSDDAVETAGDEPDEAASESSEDAVVEPTAEAEPASEPEAEPEATSEAESIEVVSESEGETTEGATEEDTASEDASTEDAPSVEATPSEAEAPAEAEPVTEVVEDRSEVQAAAPVVAPVAEAVAKPAAPVAVRDLPDAPEPVRKAAPGGPARRIRRPGGKGGAQSQNPGNVRVKAEGYTADGQREQRKDKKGKKRQRVDQNAVQENIQRVMAELKSKSGKKRRRRGARPSAEEVEQKQEEQRQEEERERTTVRVNEFLTVSELSELVDVSSTEIIGSAFKNLGLMVTINQRLDFPQIEMLLDEFGFIAVREEEYGAPEPEAEEAEAEEDLKPRPPVVTVMGHVDHGKTLLLDSIRETNVVAGESGGITQHIGAYHVELADGRSISFLDTPGHAAFTAMRARGADVTDIVILLVAADDSVMPQTREAISHARNAGVPLVVAINKCDLPAANPNHVKQELLQHDVQVEDFGGDVLAAEVSAKTGEGIEDLLEKVLLQAEMLELKANPDRDAVGTVIEAQLDPGKGALATVLIQKGTLRVGDNFIMGQFDGRVRALLDERGHPIAEAGPSVPVQVLGSGGVPQAGDTFQSMEQVKAAEIAQARQRLEREKQLRIKERGVKLGDFSRMAKAGEISSMPLIIRGDVDGSVQALSDSLEQLATAEVAVQIIHRGVGAINEEDVLLAGTAGAVIIGFRVRPHPNARQLAVRDDIDVRVYDVIYDAVDEVKAALEGMLAPARREEVMGAAEVREIFKITGVGMIAGCYVSEGIMERKHQARLIRDGIVVYDGDFASLKRFKDDAKEVREGFECGIGIVNFNDIKVGDLIECYRVEEIARTLAESKAES
jgi:translation initiation factor IF-2